MNARQKRLFEEARKRNPDLKMPAETQPPADWSEADLALVKQGVGDKTSRPAQASSAGGGDAGEAPSGEQAGSVVTYFEAKGFGFLQGKPASHFSPVFVTPDELGGSWRDGRVHLPLRVDLNDSAFGRAEAGEDCTFGFGELIAHLAMTRRIGAGTIVGSGTVSNLDPDGGPGRPIAEGGRGYSCITEQRMVEVIRSGEAKTPFLRLGDRVRIEMRDAAGHTIFGAIESEVSKN